MITDPIANMLNQIKLASQRKKKMLKFYSSNLAESILKVIKDEGYIIDYISKVDDKNIKTTTVYLKYKNGIPAIFGIKKISKSNLRVTVKAKNIPLVYSGLGTAIISTNKGVLCGKDAKKFNLGGEVFAFIW